jgi:hypothetical protein
MQSVIPFLRARFAERSSLVQLAVLSVTVLVSAGLITTDQVAAYASTAATVLALVGPLAGILCPDRSAAPDDDDAAYDDFPAAAGDK